MEQKNDKNFDATRSEVGGERRDLKATYDQIARGWFEDHRDDSWWKPTLDQFASHLQEGGTVLDVGCASGIASKYLQEKGFQVLGVDLSGEQLKIAKQEVPGADFKVVDIQSPNEVKSLPMVQGILAKAVFLHIPKAKVLEVMRKLNERLEPGGYFSVQVKEKKANGQEEEMVTEHDYGYDYQRFFSYYTLPEVEELFRQCGLSIVSKEVITPTKTSWVTVLGKK